MRQTIFRGFSHGHRHFPHAKEARRKIERLRKYFGGVDSPRIYEWDPATDEPLNFAAMNDGDIAAYLKRTE